MVADGVTFLFQGCLRYGQVCHLGLIVSIYKGGSGQWDSHHAKLIAKSSQLFNLGWEFPFLVPISGTPIRSGIPDPFPIPKIPVGKFLFKFRCWKIEKSEFRFRNLEFRKNKRRNSILLILQMMSIVIGQLVRLRMSNHMDVRPLYWWIFDLVGIRTIKHNFNFDTFYLMKWPYWPPPNSNTVGKLRLSAFQRYRSLGVADRVFLTK